MTLLLRYDLRNVAAQAVQPNLAVSHLAQRDELTIEALMTGDFSRASFPFVLTTAHSNEAHNGIATFVFNETMMSALRFQVVQETAVAQQYDLWGQIPATYVPGPVENEALLAAQFATEIESQLPILPWPALNGRVDTATFNDGLAPEAISAAGMVLDGTLYLQPCMTRYGPFPYCRYMRHGAYSLTKTMGAMLAMLWLAEKYGDAVFDLKIEDYVTVTAVHDGWQGVTFGDALFVV